MTYDDVIERFGLPARVEHRSEIRQLLQEEIARSREGTDGEEMLRLLCVQLFSIGNPEDSLLIWEAKTSSFDAGCGLDSQFLCGAGLSRTQDFLARSNHSAAQPALDRLNQLDAHDEFHEFTPAAWVQKYRKYYGLDA